MSYICRNDALAYCVHRSKLNTCELLEEAALEEGPYPYRVSEREQDKTVFSTGAFRSKKDLSKGRYDLLPWNAIHELAIHCAEGAEAHGERNCEKGIPLHSLLDSAIRHISCYMRGMDDEPHLRAALWNIAFAIEMLHIKPEMQDIPSRKKIKVPKECYEEYGTDLDGCSRQENEGCTGCNCLIKD